MLVVDVNLGKLIRWGDINSTSLKFVLLGSKHDSRAVSKFFNFVIKKCLSYQNFQGQQQLDKKRKGKHENYKNKQLHMLNEKEKTCNFFKGVLRIKQFIFLYGLVLRGPLSWSATRLAACEGRKLMKSANIELTMCFQAQIVTLSS